MEYTVIVRKEHCIDRKYSCITNCPLCAAIREQLPEFPLDTVAGSHLTDKSGNTYLIPTMLNGATEDESWDSVTINKLRDGKISEFKVTFTLNKENPYAAYNPPPKEKTVYVTVPESITEQTKELILS